jgi:hypothetical protein
MNGKMKYVDCPGIDPLYVPYAIVTKHSTTTETVYNMILFSVKRCNYATVWNIY